ncbi:hypothetical protein HIM_08068 [Hirsutella minnesotensis 3608]|uniref:cutinase n=1 Tax=Hirsutella minnesotensis 3608 TaxID=1043627 RepID=A0A0F8A3W6_9HYPO|nr:hypothetical protein HIM_08068 [Hirsutella minnesotensis 3608]
MRPIASMRRQPLRGPSPVPFLDFGGKRAAALLSYLALTLLLLAGGAVGRPATQTVELLRPKDWRAVNVVLTDLLQIPALDRLAQNVCGAIARHGKDRGAMMHVSPTRNDIECGDVRIVWARGTCNPGTVGVNEGPALFEALDAVLRPAHLTLGVEGFVYPANLDDFLARNPANGPALASTVRAAMARCPESKFVLGGFSQGAMVVHDAARALGPDMSKVSAVVLFGDPYARRRVANISPSRVNIFCHKGDNVCKENGDLILPPHSTYNENADEAAMFITSQL